MERVNDFIQQTFYDHDCGSSEEEPNPFDEKDDVYFEEPSSTGPGADVFADSPVTSPEASSLRRFSKSYSSSQSSSRSLGRATLKNASRKLSSTEGLGLLKRSAEVLRRSKDIRVVEQSIRTIRELMDCDRVNDTHILGSGVVQTVCSLLGSHGVVASLAEEICRFLTIMCDCSAEARDIADEFNAIGSLRAVMETHFELYSNTVDAAMRAIGVLCKYSPEIRATLLHTRSIEWILVCSRQWRSARSLQISAFLCLERALFQLEESQQRTVSLGIFQELLYAMHLFEEDSGIQHRALALLNTLIGPSADYRIMSASEGSVERVIYNLQAFAKRTEVISCAARASEYYCMTESSRVQFTEANGAEVMLEAFQQFLAIDGVVASGPHKMAISNCFRALGQISLHSSWRTLLYEPEIIRNILYGASKYADDAMVAECVSTLFRNMSVEEKVRRKGATFFNSRTRPPKFVAEQLVPRVNSLLSKNTSNATVAENCCTTMLNFCVQGRTSLVKHNSPNLLHSIQQVVEKFPDRDVVIELGVSLLMRVSPW